MKQDKPFINDRQKVGCETWGCDVSHPRSEQSQLIYTDIKNLFAKGVGRFGYLDLKIICY